MIERKILFADDRAAIGRDDFADLLVHDVRPDVVRRRQIEFLRAGLLHQPGNQRIDLLRRHRAGAEDERVAFLPFVLLGVDVELPALDDGGALDGLPRGAVDAAEDHVDLVVLDELGRLGFRNAVDRCAVLQNRSSWRPNRPPLALMSSITILATLALAMPMNESGPVWSAITPTLIDGSLMAISSVAAGPRGLGSCERECRRRAGPHMGWIPYAADIPCWTRPRSSA